MKTIQSFHPMQKYRHLMNRVQSCKDRVNSADAERKALIANFDKQLKALNARLANETEVFTSLVDEGRALIPQLDGFIACKKTLQQFVVDNTQK